MCNMIDYTANNKINIKKIIVIIVIVFLLFIIMMWGTVEDANRRIKAKRITDSVRTSFVLYTELHQCSISRFGVFSKYYYGFYFVKIYTDNKIKNKDEIIITLKKMFTEERVVILFFTASSESNLPYLIQKPSGVNIHTEADDRQNKE